MHEATRDLNGDPSAALMSVVLATDTFETILPVVRHLRHQTVRERLELLIVAPDIEAIAKNAAELDGFAAVRLVSVKSLRPFGSARQRSFTSTWAANTELAGFEDTESTRPLASVSVSRRGAALPAAATAVS